MTLLPEDDGPWVEVDLAAVAANWRAVAKAYTGLHVGAVVKHDAYGLGASRIGPWLARQGCRHFWVDTFGEGQALRAALVDAAGISIFVMHGLQGRDPDAFVAAGLIPVISSAPELARLRSLRSARSRSQGNIRVAVQLDIGLTRLGVQGLDLESMGPESWFGLEVEAWVAQLTRFDQPESPACLAQRERFLQWTAGQPAALRSLAASACVFSDPQWHLDHARVGSALYGVATGPVLEGRLRPAVTLKARVLRVQRVPAGTGVGYGSRWITPQPCTLATLALGYGHGLPQAFGERGHVVAHGQRVPLRGGAAMGLATAEVSALPEGQVCVGDWVEVFGSQLALHEAAQAVGLAPNALLVPTAKLVRRTYLEGAVASGAAA